MNHSIAYMKQGMASLAQAPPTMSIARIPQVRSNSIQLLKSSKVPHLLAIHHIHIRRYPSICCTKLPPWEHSPLTSVHTDKSGNNFLENPSELFETLRSGNKAENPTTKADHLTATTDRALAAAQARYLKLPMWVFGPCLLLITGMVPTLWLPISTIFIGPNEVSLFSLVGLDCIFHLGATLFLLMADYCAKTMNLRQVSKSKSPSNYQLCNLGATLAGFLIPLMLLLASQRGFMQPHLPFLPFAVLLGPYMLLLSVQVLTEILTWHWKSPVWLVTPIVYEGYRVLQLMRGLKLGAEIDAPAWVMHSIRGLVCWWILVLGMQLMRVAWFVGFTAQASQQQVSSSASDAQH
ncbi:uncharacterized protein LOC108468660 [Gossypium arboreum]|uniref:Uncharacterized protein n=2 Tax=Gossypium TaxID=3633 RepID=A0ABR0P204_GOSAR|nr:uncharacterized protein LOC107935876 isoform X1 [Gossypium hirsutum]XP_017625022.2 uncharacterized protein LOC108468660 [Gossypium arboreum]KAK5812659.1 hypothetical protein PVK06_028096 [Gossypium arboreum]